MTFVNLGTCENPAPPNVPINNLTSILPSGRYPDDGSAIIRCPNGFTLYGRPHGTATLILCVGGCWREPVEKFRCIPNDQCELKSLHSH